MNLKIDKSRGMEFHTVTSHKETSKKTDAKLILAEQLQINQFREQNSPQKNRAKQIFYKFRAGQKLTAEELDFIAKEEPNTYRQIRQIMQERQMMEAQMEAAETKEEVAAIRLNEMTKIQATMGEGEQAAAQAETTMARVNQMDSAYKEYTATVEYKDKEDAKSRAEEKREILEELKRQQETYSDKIKEKAEETDQTDTPEESDSAAEEIEKTAENANKILEEAYDLEDDKKVKSKKKTKRKTKRTDQQPMNTSVDYQALRQKVRGMYHTEKGSSAGNGKEVDLSL